MDHSDHIFGWKKHRNYLVVPCTSSPHDIAVLSQEKGGEVYDPNDPLVIYISKMIPARQGHLPSAVSSQGRLK